MLVQVVFQQTARRGVGTAARVSVLAIALVSGLIGGCSDDDVDVVTEATDTPTSRPLTTQATTTTTSIANPPTPQDERLIRSFLEFAASPSPGTATLMSFADEVALGLGSTLVAEHSSEELTDAGAWSIEIDEGFRGYDGPFSALDFATEATDVVITLGPHPHCASPPVAPPEDVADFRRVSAQPAPDSIDSCLQWWTVDLFVTTDGEVAAVTLDLWEP